MGLNPNRSKEFFMKYLAVFFTCLFTCLASLNLYAMKLEPGLWKMKVEMKQNGKKFDPMAQMRAAMKDMPAEQRKQMEKMMKEQGMDMADTEELEQCYTKEMLDKVEFEIGDKGECDAKVIEKSDKKYSAKMTCKDGSKGTVKMQAKSAKSYTGEMEMNNPNGMNFELDFSGNFISKDCGDVKPTDSMGL